MTDPLTKEKKTRSSQRGQLTKLYTRFDEVRAGSDPDNVVVVLDLIKAKIELLENVDKTILSLVEEKDYESELVEGDDYLAKAKEKHGIMKRQHEKAVKPAPASDPKRTGKSTGYRLPKLQISRFNGDLLNWQTFEDDFNSAVGSNSDLTDIEKFQFLRAQLDAEAYDTIAGLPLTSKNYEQAISLLKERYGKKHKIINAYMRALWDLPNTADNVKSLRGFMDKLETYIRGLRSLEKTEDSYGELLVPMVLDKLPPNVCKEITRANGTTEFTLKVLRDSITNEIQAMEAADSKVSHSDYSAVPDPPSHATSAFYTQSQTKRQGKPARNTSNAFVKKTPKCAFCKGEHWSNDCVVFSNVDQRHAVAVRDKLCFNCLGKHRAADCRSQRRCKHCDKRHHTAICKTHAHPQNSRQYAAPQTPRGDQSQKTPPANAQTVEHAKHAITTKTRPVLLKTARADVTHQDRKEMSTILFDEGATRSFIRKELVDKLQMRPTRTEKISLAVFGDDTSQTGNYDIVEFMVETPNNERINLSAIVVPEISTPMQNLISRDLSKLPHLRNLKLAHPPSNEDTLRISVLVGADHYWDIVGDQVIRGPGPIAVSSKLGYLLSGPTLHTHTTAGQTDELLTRLWKLETIGITDEIQTSPNDLDDFRKNIRKTDDGNGYVAKLPWKQEHPPLPTNYVTTTKRTRSMIRRYPPLPTNYVTTTKRTRSMIRRLTEETRAVYHRIIIEQESRGFIERIHNDDVTTGHYLPHRAVEKDSITTPIRIVYDCSAKVNNEPSLNDCLEKGPPLLNELVGILIRFRLHPVAFVSDIEKAFLNVGLDENDRDFTKFFWIENPEDPESDFITYRFSSVLFGSVSSPALLNAVVRTHLDQQEGDTADNLKRNIYVDNVVQGPNLNTSQKVSTSMKQTLIWKPLVSIFAPGRLMTQPYATLLHEPESYKKMKWLIF
jgi:hypothetical protein